MTLTIRLCLNCLDRYAQPRPIGPDIGPQMDPTRTSIDLCIDCWDYLVTGQMDKFHARYTESRVVSR